MNFQDYQHPSLWFHYKLQTKIQDKNIMLQILQKLKSDLGNKIKEYLK